MANDLDYGGKRVVVIGCGATAVTIIPAIAKTAAHVTMLQRSPTYIVSRAVARPIANGCAAICRRGSLMGWRAGTTRCSGFILQSLPPQAGSGQEWIVAQVREQLGADYDVTTHFTPRYQPWDQRLCFAPDADFFQAIKTGKADVVTDQIERFTGSGIRLRSGRELTADIVVTATGLKLKMLGGIQLVVDGKPVNLPKP